jgi:uncharacterized SAM-binding protein YcdF (DUF218 family)
MSAPTIAAVRGQRAPARAPRGSRIVGFLVVLMLLGLLAVMLLPVLAGWRVMAASHSDDRARTDAIVVLGAAQYNGEPSPVLRSRLRHALRLYDQSVAPRIVTVGGKQPGDRYTEAATGLNYLTAQGVPAADVSAVAVGKDTRRSLVAVAKLARTQGWASVTLVSDPAHMARVDAIAKRLGFTTHLSPTRVGDGTVVTSGYLARETAGLLLFGLVQWWGTPIILD